MLAKVVELDSPCQEQIESLKAAAAQVGGWRAEFHYILKEVVSKSLLLSNTINLRLIGEHGSKSRPCIAQKNWPRSRVWPAMLLGPKKQKSLSVELSEPQAAISNREFFQLRHKMRLQQQGLPHLWSYFVCILLYHGCYQLSLKPCLNLASREIMFLRRQIPIWQLFIQILLIAINGFFHRPGFHFWKFFNPWNSPFSIHKIMRLVLWSPFRLVTVEQKLEWKQGLLLRKHFCRI